jgi:hypothetical protein
MSSRVTLLCAILITSLITGARAECTGVVAGRLGPVHLAGGVPEGAVSITFSAMRAF